MRTGKVQPNCKALLAPTVERLQCKKGRSPQGLFAAEAKGVLKAPQPGAALGVVVERRFWSVLSLSVLPVLMAGCGGGGSSLPVTAPSSTPAPQAPQGPLFVAGLNGVVVFPIGAQGTAAPLNSIGGFGGGEDANPPWTKIASLGAGPGGSMIVGTETFFAGEDGGPPPRYDCNLYVYASNANGSSKAVSTPTCSGDLYPAAVYGRANGDIDYLAQPYGGQNQIIRVRASDGTSVVRLTASNGATFSRFTEDAAGDLYVTDGLTVKEYNGQSDIAQPSPVRTVPLSVSASFLALAPDGTIYAAAASPGSIEAITPSGTTRTVGPFSKQIGAIATDSAGELYVGLNASGGVSNEVDVFAANAAGNSPLRVLTNPVTAQFGPAVVAGIAIGQ